MASLKKGGACKAHEAHGGVLGGELLRELRASQPAQEIINAIAKYNMSFGMKRHSFKVDDRTCRGPKDAKVTLVEFSDFECPYCGAARPMLEELQKVRPQVRLCWMPFPLSAHPNAIPAGQAALFARDAGKFWAMHDALFINQMSFTEEASSRSWRASMGLDDKALGKAMGSGGQVQRRARGEQRDRQERRRRFDSDGVHQWSKAHPGHPLDSPSSR